MSQPLEQVFPGRRDVIADVRAFVDKALQGTLSFERISDALQAVDELAANAIVHAVGPFRVKVSTCDLWTQVHVIDGNGGRSAPPEVWPSSQAVQDGTEEESGRGLFLVDAFSDEHGQIPASTCTGDPAAIGWCCWFRIYLPRRQSMSSRITNGVGER